VHISFDPKQRNQTLTATFKNGKATYSEFVWWIFSHLTNFTLTQERLF
jgi:hypothetical protein